MSSNLFSMVQDFLRENRNSGFDLNHPNGVVINNKTYPAVGKSILFSEGGPAHASAAFDIPHENGTTSKIVHYPVDKASYVNRSIPWMQILHPYDFQGDGVPELNHDTAAYNDIDLNPVHVFQKDFEFFDDYYVHHNVYPIKWEEGGSHTRPEKHPHINDETDWDTFHKVIADNSTQPHESRISWKFNQHRVMKSEELQQYVKRYNERFPNNKPHLIGVYKKVDERPYFTAHHYNVKTEQLTKQDSDLVFGLDS